MERVNAKSVATFPPESERKAVKTNVSVRILNGVPDSTAYVCPGCHRMSVFVDDVQFPSPPAGAFVNHLPSDVESSWQEARRSYSAGAYTACVLMCRKLLMHMACDKAGTKEGSNFTTCIDDLIASNELPKSHEPALNSIRQSGNAGTHKLEAITESEAATTISVTEQCLRNLYELPAKII